MYEAILIIHSWFRWFVLVGLIFVLYRAYYGWFTNKTFTRYDELLRHGTATTAHIQLIFGIFLYSLSPIVAALLDNFKESLHLRELRFFGLEHAFVMLIAIFLITVGSMLAKRRDKDKDKFKTVALWYTTALVFILILVPWEFLPIIGRPYFRVF